MLGEAASTGLRKVWVEHITGNTHLQSANAASPSKRDTYHGTSRKCSIRTAIFSRLKIMVESANVIISVLFYAPPIARHQSRQLVAFEISASCRTNVR